MKSCKKNERICCYSNHLCKVIPTSNQIFEIIYMGFPFYKVLFFSPRKRYVFSLLAIRGFYIIEFPIPLSLADFIRWRKSLAWVDVEGGKCYKKMGKSAKKFSEEVPKRIKVTRVVVKSGSLNQISVKRNPLRTGGSCFCHYKEKWGHSCYIR